MQGWRVYLKDWHIKDPNLRWHLDEVYFNIDCDRDYVLRSLIDHDGYDPGIEIWKVK